MQKKKNWSPMYFFYISDRNVLWKEKNWSSVFFVQNEIICIYIYVGWSDHCQPHIWFSKERKKREKKKYCHEKKRNINYKEERKRKLYRRVIGVGVLLVGVRKGKFRVVWRAFWPLGWTFEGGLFMILEGPSLRSFCEFVDFVVSSVWCAKIK